MAITFINETICPICGEQLKSSEKIFSFPTFVPNSKDPFYQFNDSSFHVKCLQKHPLGEKAIRFGEYFITKIRPENRICNIGGNIIQNFNDYIFIDLLTSNEQEDLYNFNFITLDRNNLKKWNERTNFIVAATKFKNAGKWSDLSTYKYLDSLIALMEGI